MEGGRFCSLCYCKYLVSRAASAQDPSVTPAPNVFGGLWPCLHCMTDPLQCQCPKQGDTGKAACAALRNYCSRGPTECGYFAPMIVCILFQNLVSKGILSRSLFSHQQSIYSLCFLHSCCGHAQLPAGFQTLPIFL